MVISNTIHNDEDSTRKQPYLSAYIASALKTGGIDRTTKGVIAYEALLLAHEEYSDSLSSTEDHVFGELSDVFGVNARSMLDEMVRSRFAEARHELRNQCEYDDPDETLDRTNVHLSASLADQLPGRGISDEIEEAIVYVQASPWGSRIERLDDLVTLVQYARDDDVENSSEWVQSIISGKSEEYDVGDIHTRLIGDRDWWEWPDVTLDDLRECGDDIPNTSRHRIPVLQTAIDNSDAVITDDELIDILTADTDDGVWGVSLPTARKYIKAIDLPGTIVVDFAQTYLSELANELRGGMSSKNKKRLPKSDCALLGVKKEVCDVDGHYASYDDALEAIDTIRENLTGNWGTLGPVRSEAQSRFLKRADRFVGEMEMAAEIDGGKREFTLG